MSFEIRNFDIQTMSKFEFVRVEIHFSRLVTIENLNCSCIHRDSKAAELNLTVGAFEKSSPTST